MSEREPWNMDELARSLIYDAGKYLYQKAKNYWSQFELAQIINQVKEAQSAFADQNLYAFLKWLYPKESILERCRHTYPVVIFPAPEFQWNVMETMETVDLKLERIAPTDEDLLIKDATYRGLVDKLDCPHVDRPTYTMTELIAQPRLGLNCALGSYFRALDSCDVLEWELLHNWSKTRPKSEKDFKEFLARKLPLRRKLHESIDNPVRSGKGRSAAIAISTLIAFVDEKRETYIWLKLRSRRAVAVHGGLLHVIPSFRFQPATLYLEKEFSIIHNIFREYLEEIFNRPEPEEDETEPRYFYGDPRLKYLQDLLEKEKKAHLFFTGLAVNLLNLRPEICTLLFIQDPRWYEFHETHPSKDMRFHINEEFVRNIIDMAGEEINKLENLVGKLPYSKDDYQLFKEGNLQPSRMVPPGAAAFWLGLDVLRKVLRNK